MTDQAIPKLDQRSLIVLKARIKDLFAKRHETQGELKEKADNNRKRRRANIDVEAMKQTGQLLAHETYISHRVIDNNIRNENVIKLDYLTQPSRLAIFTPTNRLQAREQRPIGVLEAEFTRVMRYPNWILPYMRWYDGAELHGRDYLEVIYDPTAPGGVVVEHVGFENLLFDDSFDSIQSAPIVARAHKVSTVMLADLSERYAFNKDVLAELKQKLKSDMERSAYVSCDHAIYRIFCKRGGVVYVSWFSKELDKFLRDPEPFYNGVDEQTMEQGIDPMTGMPVANQVWKPVTEVEYPFFVLTSSVYEDSQLSATVGRGESDLHMQEALTRLLSSFVNAAWAATRVMCSPDSDGIDGNSAAPAQLSAPIEYGKMWNRPMRFFSTPWPDSTMATVIQQLQTINAEGNQQIAWAVANRKDSRKTAAEINTAQDKQNQFSSTKVITFAIALTPMLNYIWPIIRSGALQGAFPFCVGEDGQNDVNLISTEVLLLPAGDQDYVKRQEFIQAFREDWEILGTTPAGIPMLRDYLALRYGENADTYIAALDKAEGDKTQMIVSLVQALEQVMTDEAGQIKPEHQQLAPMLQQLKQQVAAMAPDTNVNPNPTAE